MRKALVALVGIGAVAAAGWTGLWFYGKGRIAGEIRTQAGLIRDQGGDAAFDDIEIGGFPFGYDGRIIDPKLSLTQDMPDREGTGTGQATYTWSAPWIEARAGVMNPNSVTFTFPETQRILLDMPDMEGGPLPVTVTSQAMTITTERSSDDIAFRGGATELGASLTQTTEKSGKVDIAYVMRAFQTSGKVGTERSEIGLPRMAMTYSIDGLDGSAEIEGTTDKPGGTVEFRSGAVTGENDSLGTAITGTMTMNDLIATLRTASLGNAPLEFGIGTFDVSTRIPDDASPEAQDFGYRVGLKDITVADLVWNIFDPQQAFSREINALIVDLDGTAIFSATPSNAEAFVKAMENGLPIDMKSLRVNDLTLDALGVKAKAEGQAMLDAGVPQGTAGLSVEGFPTLMDSLVKSGRIPPQQAMVVQLMVESFGKMDESGKTVRFDFEAKDGMMYVNSVPIGEAPMMPQ